jgi:hypothetical protein
MMTRIMLTEPPPIQTPLMARTGDNDNMRFILFPFKFNGDVFSIE